MCLCITKQETAHKGQARYRRQLLTGGGKRKLEKRNTRMSSDYAGYMSHLIHSSVRFFFISLFPCLLAVKNRWFLAELGRTSLLLSRNITRLTVLLRRILIWFSSACGQKTAVKGSRCPSYKGTTAPLGNTLVFSLTVIACSSKQRSDSWEGRQQISRTIPDVQRLQYFLAYNLRSTNLWHRIHNLCSRFVLNSALQSLCNSRCI